MTKKLNEEIWSYLQLHKADATANSRASIAEANQAERDLNNQLILVSTVIIGVTGAILAGGIFNETSTTAQAITALVSVGCALLSIVSGVVYYFVIIKFNQKWAVTHRNIALKDEVAAVAAAEGDKNAYRKAMDEAIKLTEQNETTSQKWLYVELALFAGAALGLLVLIAAIVIDWSGIVLA